MNDDKCLQKNEWMNVWKKDWKIREMRGFCLFWFSAQTGRELIHTCVNIVRGLTHAVFYTCTY